MQTLKRFCRDQRGNALMLFAFSMVPMIGMVGVAVDYSRATKTRTAIQAAVDTTALILGRDSPTISSAELPARAEAFVAANLPVLDASSVGPTVVTRSGNTLRLCKSADVDLTFTRVIGANPLQVNACAEVVWGQRKIEVALSLDNTGSMAANGKMTEMKKAAKSFVDILNTAALSNNADVKLGIVPFTTLVKPGTSYKNASWLDFPNAAARDAWNGCVYDRAAPYDATDVAPSVGVSDTLFDPAPISGPVSNVYGCGIKEIRPLTDVSLPANVTALKNHIDGMVADGWTNVGIGVAWGWHMLTPSEPLTTAAPPTDVDTQKFLILLTDGENNYNRRSLNSTTGVYTSGLRDQSTAATCAALKATNIRVYTIRVLDGNVNLLRDCATTPSMYFDVQNASQLTPLFEQIAKELTRLRIST